jgi:hypothetical protein
MEQHPVQLRLPKASFLNLYNQLTNNNLQKIKPTTPLPVW